MSSAAKSAIQVLIVDDHALVRQGILRMLTEEWPRCVFLECGDALEARRLLEQRDWDFVLLDQRLKGVDGLSLVSHARKPGRILLFTAYSSQEMIRRAKELGCGGFVTKDESPSEFLDAVRAVVAGRSHFPRLVERAAQVVISSRETEIRDGLLEGKAPIQIAQDLGISYGSVQTYKKRLFKKLGVTSMLDFLRQSVQGS
jgi:DNA-binding NarL/FixJ family response regulator